MKKIILLLTFGFIFFLSSNAASAAEHEKNNYPTKLETEVLNQELQGLVKKVNERLAKGEEDIKVSSKNLKVVFKQEDVINPVSSKGNQLNSMGVSASAIGSKSYQAYVANTTGFNFRHSVYGTFTWNGSLLSQVTADEDLTGTMYSRSATTKVTGVDGTIGRTAKIGKVSSKGTFIPLKFSPVSFYTTIIVDVYAPTKSYRIVTAKITN